MQHSFLLLALVSFCSAAASVTQAMPAQATTERISLSTIGGDPNSAVRDPVLSDDGRFIAFSSLANTLVAGDVNGESDVFVYDSATGAISLVSVDDAGTQVGNIDPSEVLALGTVEDVQRETARLLKVFSDTPRFILNAGCAIPPHAPPENIQAMIRVACG